MTKIYAVALDPDRRALWRSVYGEPKVPIRSAVRKRGAHPFVGVQLFFELDVAALSPEHLERVVDHIATKFKAFGGDRARIRADVLGEHGVPIIDTDVELVDEAGEPIEKGGPIDAFPMRMVW